MRKTIYVENSSLIEYDDNGAYVNGVKVSDEEKKEEQTWEQVAYSVRKMALEKYLKRQYENTVVLTGAGSSYNIGVGEKKGKLMDGLWKEAVSKFGYEKLEEFCQKINFNDLKPIVETTDIEKLLTHAQLYQYVFGVSKSDKMTENLKKMVKDECTLILPSENPHRKFLRKLVSKKAKYTRPKIFTLNYDTFFEQAAEKNGFMIIDGFSYTYPRKFKGTNFDLDVVTRITNRNVLEDNFISNVVHIYKPHGSINWQKNGDDVIIENETKESLMIYPSSNKYESSYQQPFFEMMSRFQQETRAKNTLLIIIGYSFGDAHINAMIFEALSVNSSITVIFVAPDIYDENKYKELRNEVFQTGNVIMTNQTFQEFVEVYPYSEIYAKNIMEDQHV